MCLGVLEIVFVAEFYSSKGAPPKKKVSVSNLEKHLSIFTFKKAFYSKLTATMQFFTTRLFLIKVDGTLYFMP